jgi:hypothetical protein
MQEFHCRWSDLRFAAKRLLSQRPLHDRLAVTLVTDWSWQALLVSPFQQMSVQAAS